MFGPDQLALTPVVIAEREDAGGRGVQPHLVLDRDDADVVGLPRIAVAVQPHLRHQEQRNPARPRRGIRRAGEDEMDDVVRHVVIAERDVDLRPLDRPPAVIQRRRLRPQRADIAARLWLGQVHRPRPFAGGEPRQIRRLLFGGAMMRERLDRPDGQRRAQRERHVGPAQRLQHRGLQREGQALTAPFFRHPDRAPAAGDVIGIGLFVPGRHHDASGGPGRADRVADARQRCPFARRELSRPSSTASTTSGVAAANRSVAASSGRRTTCSSTKRCSVVGGVYGMRDPFCRAAIAAGDEWTNHPAL